MVGGPPNKINFDVSGRTYYIPCREKYFLVFRIKILKHNLSIKVQSCLWNTDSERSVNSLIQLNRSVLLYASSTGYLVLRI